MIEQLALLAYGIFIGFIIGYTVGYERREKQE
jgi:hypothetical protein